jgi:hypothetical protein
MTRSRLTVIVEGIARFTTVIGRVTRQCCHVIARSEIPRSAGKQSHRWDRPARNAGIPTGGTPIPPEIAKGYTLAMTGSTITGLQYPDYVVKRTLILATGIRYACISISV